MRYWIFLLSFLAFTSCVRQKKTLYLLPHTKGNYEKFQLDSIQEYKIQKSDVLAVDVNSTVATELDLINNKFKTATTNQVDPLNGFIVDNNGFINMPIVGKIKVEQLTCSQANDTIQKNLNQYLQFVTVSVKVGFRFNVLGEVGRTGQIQALTNSLTIFEALALAGDINEFGNRENVKIIRRKNNEVEVFVVDVSKSEIITSKFYYLQNNDTIIVDRRKAKTFKSNVANLGIISGVISIILIIVTTTRNFR